MAFANPNMVPAESSSFEGTSHTWTRGNDDSVLAISPPGFYLVGSKSLAMSNLSGTTDTYGFTDFITGIEAGTSYVSRVPFFVPNVALGAEVTIRILWYTSDSASNIGLIDESMTVTSTNGWQSVNFPSLSGVAPTGATRARVRFVVKGLKTTDKAYVDEVYFGVAAHTDGNLFPYEIQAAENVTGWTATGGELLRASGSITGGGYTCAGVSASGAGGISLSQVTGAVVKAGVEYQAEFWGFSALARTGEAVVQWLNSGGTQVGQSTMTRSVGANAWTLFIAVGVAPVGAVAAKVWFKSSAVAAGEQIFIDAVTLRVATNEPGNLLSYDEYSTESHLPSWTVSNGVLMRAYLTSTLTDGYYANRVTPSAPGMVSLTLDRLVPVTPGKTYLVGGTVLRHNPTSEVTRSAFRTRIDWYDASGALFEADLPDQFYVQYASAEYSAHVNTETRTCPEGAAFAKYTAEIDHTDTVADMYFLDKCILKEASPEYIVAPSSGTGMIRLTINTQPTGVNAVRMSIQRVEPDGSAHFLRSYAGSTDKLPYAPGGPYVIEDYEAPLGVQVWYRIEWWNAAGTTLGTRLYTGLIRTPVLDDPDYVWFKSPGLPALNTPVMVESAIAWTREARLASYRIVGRRNPVNVSDRRAGRTATLSLLVWDESANALFDSLLDAGTPALIQAMPGYGVEGNLYLSIGGVEVESVTGAANIPGWRWTLPVVEVDRPDGALQGSVSGTWQDIADGFSTWGDLFDSHDSWADVLTGTS